MVGVLIASHGGFAEGLLNGAELLVGKQEQVETLGLYHGDGIEEFTAKMNAAFSVALLPTQFCSACVAETLRLLPVSTWL